MASERFVSNSSNFSNPLHLNKVSILLCCLWTGAWCEPLEENAHIEETEGDTTVAEGNQLINENLGASSAELVVSSNGDKTGKALLVKTKLSWVFLKIFK